MKKVKIKTEYPPNRCEICHKTDCFDVDTLFCSRCKNLAYKEENFQVDKLEHQIKENYLEISLNKNYGWKRYSNEVNKKFTIAGGLVFFNFVCFVGILKLSAFSRITEIATNVIGGLLLILLIEYLLLKIFSSYNKLFCQNALIGVYLTLATIAGIISLFVLMVIYCYLFVR